MLLTDASRKLVAEAVGTGFLLAAVVGSGIAAQRLSPADAGLQLLENAAATGLVLAVLILVLGPVSGGHFNPVVTLVARLDGTLTNGETARFVAAQLLGGCAGAVVANAMFGLPAFEWSATTRSGTAPWLSEVVATFGLLVVIYGLVRNRGQAYIPSAVGAWIAGAYWFTSSTSFANPAATAARSLTDTLAGIRPSSVPMFVAAQLVGTALAVGLLAVLWPSAHTASQEPVDATA